MLCQCKYCDKKILSRFTMKIWNNKKPLYNAEMEAILWHWILEQKAFELQTLELMYQKLAILYIFIRFKM